jgi:hypothetical protein
LWKVSIIVPIYTSAAAAAAVGGIVVVVNAQARGGIPFTF